MNNKISLALLVLIIAPLTFAFREAGQNETNGPAATMSVKPVAREKYVIMNKESVVTWKGSMAFAGKGEHIGYVSISKGELIMDKNQMTGGSVVLDMTTITDKVHGSDNSLIDHLKDPDFFDVKKFPIAVFVITNVAAATGGTVDVTGNLTIKGITNAITFPATLDVKTESVTASGKVTIDRTKWDVRYKSGKFFSDLADEAIADDIEFDMKIVAKR
jgi:polyisoprenoid-binding protein YceI